MHKKTAYRWHLTIVLTVGVAFALGSLWLVQVMHNSADGQTGDASNNEPDYIVERFSFVRMTTEGKPRYIISGAKLTHRPVDDSAEIELPMVQSLSAEQPPMLMHAQRARIDHGRSELHLMGNVDIERAESKLGQHLRLQTEALTIFPDDDKMETDQPVSLMLGGSTLTGVGMQANNATGEMSVKNKVHIAYPRVAH